MTTTAAKRFQPELMKRGQTTSEEQPVRQVGVSRGGGERALGEEADHQETEESADQVPRKQTYGVGEPLVLGKPLLPREVERPCE